MKKIILCFTLLLAFSGSGTFVCAVETGGVSYDAYKEHQVVTNNQSRGACDKYKNEVDATFLSYLNNNKKYFKERAKVSFTVTKYGNVQNVSLLQSTGSVKNDKFVMDMVESATFPAFPPEIISQSLTFNYYISNPRKIYVMPSLAQSASSQANTYLSVSPSFAEKLLIFDSVVIVANLVLKICTLCVLQNL